MNHPDPKKHKILSFIKSFIRILGYVLLTWDLALASIVLLISELVGIWEETV
jgi:hypothetical protein